MSLNLPKTGAVRVIGGKLVVLTLANLRENIHRIAGKAHKYPGVYDMNHLRVRRLEMRRSSISEGTISSKVAGIPPASAPVSSKSWNLTPQYLLFRRPESSTRVDSCEMGC